MRVTDGKLIVISGASRCGKTALTKQLVASHGRLIVWDIEDQFGDLCDAVAYKIKDLYALIKEGKQKKIRFVAAKNIREEFENWANCVMLAALEHGNIAAIAEELADVTSVSKAGQNWGMLCRRGLKRGVTIYAISQRWQEADKTALGNASAMMVFRQSSGSDDQYIAKASGCAVADVAALRPLEYLYCDKVARKITKKRVIFTKN